MQGGDGERGGEQEPISSKTTAIVITCTLWRKARGTWSPRLLKGVRFEIWSVYIKEEKCLSSSNNSWMLLRFGRIKLYFLWRLNNSLDSGNKS